LQTGGWDGLKTEDQRTTFNPPACTSRPDELRTSCGAAYGPLSPTNPMGVHWTGIVFGLGFAISFGYWTTDFLVVQRVSGGPHSLRAARMAPVIGSFFKMAVPFIVILPGLLGPGAVCRMPTSIADRQLGPEEA
jgi:hypothetical protein